MCGKVLNLLEGEYLLGLRLEILQSCSTSCFCLCFLTALLRSDGALLKLLQMFVTVVSQALSCMERLHFISTL